MFWGLIRVTLEIYTPDLTNLHVKRQLPAVAKPVRVIRY
jgi:hypothetical protein